jgi:hypothetical protein
MRTLFAWAGGTFVVLQLAASVTFDCLGLTIRFPELQRRLIALREEPRPPDVVYLGSSRFMTCLNSIELTKTLCKETGRSDLTAFGAAVTKGDFLVMERIVRELRDEGRVPPILLMEVNPISVAWGNRWHDVFINRQLGWTDLPEHAPEFVQTGQFGRFCMARFLPLYVYRRTLLDRLWGTWTGPSWVEAKDELSDEKMKKILATPITEAETAHSAIGVDGVHRDLRTYEIGGSNTRALERMLTECRSLGVHVVLVGSPLSSAHRREIRPEIDAAYREYLASITARFGVPFVDCHKALPDSLFLDHHHTKPLGGQIFSRLLVDRLLDDNVLGRVLKRPSVQPAVPGRLVNNPKERKIP